MSRRVARGLEARPRLRLGVLLSGPVLWLVLAYLGSLVALLLTSLYTTNDFTNKIEKTITFDNFHKILTDDVFRAITIRTVGVAAAVTLLDLAIALPLAFFMAKIATPRTRRILVVAVLMPLWASYLVKAYAWRSLLDPVGGVLAQSIGVSPGFGLAGLVILLAYLWLPYMIIPIYAGLERLPDSMLEAAGDLGAGAGRTFLSVVMPLLKPSIVAGSIFTFSLSLGDYIAVQLVGGTTNVIGLTIFKDFGAQNIPQAAAFACVPIAIMVGYLLAARRTGAFENL